MNAWTTNLQVDTRTAHLADEESTHVARQWLEAGLGEHASIAAFARFILQLLRLGAPHWLVADASRALSDEVEHARICFQAAKTFTHQVVSPGPLDTVDSSQPIEIEDILRSCILEGCFAETISAAHARAASERATVEWLRAPLERIATDETRHAEISWQFVEWSRQKFPQQLDTAKRAFASGWTHFSSPALESTGYTPAIEQFGVLLPTTKLAVQQATLTDVIQPRAACILREWEFAVS